MLARANPLGHWSTDDGPPTSGEAPLSDDTAFSADDGATRAEVVGLQEQLKAVTAERDRNVYEKSEIIAKANAFSKERDDLRERLAVVVAERECLATEKAAALRQGEEAGRQADAAAVEIARLGRMIETAPSMDSGCPALGTRLPANQRRRRLGARQNPGGAPGSSLVRPHGGDGDQGWLHRHQDRRFFVRWAIPKIVELGKRLMREVETRLAKK